MSRLQVTGVEASDRLQWLRLKHDDFISIIERLHTFGLATSSLGAGAEKCAQMAPVGVAASSLGTPTRWSSCAELQSSKSRLDRIESDRIGSSRIRACDGQSATSLFATISRRLDAWPVGSNQAKHTHTNKQQALRATNESNQESRIENHEEAEASQTRSMKKRAKPTKSLLWAQRGSTHALTGLLSLATITVYIIIVASMLARIPSVECSKLAAGGAGRGPKSIQSVEQDPMEACYLSNNRASESLTISESTPIGSVVGELMVSSYVISTHWA